MAKIRINITIRLTTSERYKCKNCKIQLKGEKGYIFIRFGQSEFGYNTKEVRLCHNCFKGFLDEIDKAKVGIEDRYKITLKKKIVSNL